MCQTLADCQQGPPIAMRVLPPVCLLLLLTKEVLNNKLSRGRDAAAFDDIIIIINIVSSTLY